MTVATKVVVVVVVGVVGVVVGVVVLVLVLVAVLIKYRDTESMIVSNFLTQYHSISLNVI